MESTSGWQPQLVASGARIDDTGVVMDFGDPDAEAEAAREAAVVVPLLGMASIKVSGVDAGTFLNSQLTSDVAVITPQHAQYSGYCTPKGRLLATMLVFSDGEAYWMMLPAELAEPVAGSLRRYVLRAKVNLQVSNCDPVLLGVTGPRAATLLAKALTPAGPQPFDSARQQDTLLITLPFNRYLVVSKAELATATWQALAAQLRPAGWNWWQLQTIRSGIATVTPATQEVFIPQMLALEAYDGVSFRKGCYPGQEIVARTHYLGALKRRLYYGRCRQSLVPGDAIVDASDGKTVGTVTNAAANDESGWDLLAVVQADVVEARLDLQTRDGTPLKIVAPATDILAGGSD